MKVYHNIDEVPYIGNAIVTIGNFDGVHLGHAQILKSLASTKAEGLQSMVITMWPHPRKILHPESFGLRSLTSMDEKIALIRSIGIDHLLIVPFTLDFAKLTAKQFLEDILIAKIGIKKVVLGYDNRFGKDREGGLDFLAKNSLMLGFEVEEISKQEVESLAISSSQIRHCLLEGKLAEARSLLGRHYSVEGTVKEGNKLGRTIGFPTANISVAFDEKLIPKNGVYAVWTYIGQAQFKGMMNIGYRPTIDGHTLVLEVNIFDFDQNIYGQTISIEFVHYLREEQKFASLEALKAQLQIDKLDAISFLI